MSGYPLLTTPTSPSKRCRNYRDKKTESMAGSGRFLCVHCWTAATMSCAGIEPTPGTVGRHCCIGAVVRAMADHVHLIADLCMQKSAWDGPRVVDGNGAQETTYRGDGVRWGGYWLDIEWKATCIPLLAMTGTEPDAGEFPEDSGGCCPDGTDFLWPSRSYLIYVTSWSCLL